MTDYPLTILTDAPVRTQVPLEPIAIVLADVLPDFVFTVQDQDGALVTLTAATATFSIRKAGTTTITNATPACTVTPATSTITYDLLTADFPRSGLYEGELAITFSGGLVQTIYKLVYMSVRSSF